MRQADGQVGLAGAGRAEEHHVLLGGDEVQGAQVGDHVAFAGRGRGRSRTPPGSCGPGTGRRGSGPRRRGTPGRRPRVAGRRPGTPRGSRTRPGPARPAGGTDSRSVGAFSARVRNATSAARSPGRRLARGAITLRPPSVAGAQQRRRSRPGRAARPPARPAGRSTADPLPAQRLGRRVMLGVGDGLVPGPDPLVVGDQPARRRAPGPGPGPATTSTRRPITAGWTE